MKYNIYALGIMTAIVSFLGFVVENIWLALTKGYINNRNMNAPFLLGYGLLIMFMYFVLGTPGKPTDWGVFKGLRAKWGKYVAYFVCAMVLVSLGEIILGTVVEELCGFEYWNYSNLPLHITKYTSVPTSIAFAAMITFVMGKMFTPIMDWIMRMDATWVKVIGSVLIIVMVSDFFVSFYHMIHGKNFYLKWKISLK